MMNVSDAGPSGAQTPLAEENVSKFRSTLMGTEFILQGVEAGVPGVGSRSESSLTFPGDMSLRTIYFVLRCPPEGVKEIDEGVTTQRMKSIASRI